MDRSSATPFAGVHRANEQVLTPQESVVVDVRQDELMAMKSVEGRPVSHRLRRAEWRSLLIGAPVLAVAAVAWAMIRGVSIGAIIGFGIAFMLLLLLGGWPVWAAGLLRGKEERVARKEAVSELSQGKEPHLDVPLGISAKK